MNELYIILVLTDEETEDQRHSLSNLSRDKQLISSKIKTGA